MIFVLFLLSFIFCSAFCPLLTLYCIVFTTVVGIYSATAKVSFVLDSSTLHRADKQQGDYNQGRQLIISTIYADYCL